MIEAVTLGLIAAVAALNVWYWRKRKRMTADEREQDEAEWRVERNLW